VPWSRSTKSRTLPCNDLSSWIARFSRVVAIRLSNRALLQLRRSGAELRFVVELLYRRGGEPQVGSEVRFTRVLRLSRSAPQFMNDVNG
jgi:hypothetical protein